MNADPAEPAHVDVLIVGAGLSGIGAAAHLQARLPHKSYLILEARADLGGTWDLFRYPGIRSDSDMHTLGYRFKPWTSGQAIAEGASIKAYIAETARERGIDRHIRYGHRVVAADWSSRDARWSLTVERGADGARLRLSCGFLLLCSGYYSYAEGYRPRWADEDRFTGRLVHPQQWPADLDHAGKRVVVIGSGATAVTLVPELARTAACVVMLQRSPGYVVSRPSVDRWADRARRWLPGKAAYALTRWKNVLYGQLTYRLARRRPDWMKRRLIAMAARELGPGYDVGRHFTPRYAPWDQRICAAPDADLFAAVRAGRACVVTDTIERFTPGGLQLTSGKELAADIIVTATGLTLNVAGDIALSLDGVRIDPAAHLNYKGCMLSDVPNLALVFGYTNASWTLKADLVSTFLCRVLRRMDALGAAKVVARRDPDVRAQPFVDFTSGYVQRALSILPSQGDRPPWRLRQSYVRDLLSLRYGRIEDGVLSFGD